MNKKTIGACAVALLALAYVGTSWMIGRQVEEKYNAQLDRTFGAQPGLKVASRSYDRGVFSARSTVVFEFDVPTLPPEGEGQESPAASGAIPAAGTHKVRVSLEDSVRHGPFPGARLAAATFETRLIAVDGIEDATRKAFEKAAAPQISTVLGFDGTYKGRALLPAGEVSDPRGSARWQALDYDFETDSAFSRVQGEVRWPLVTAQVGASDAAPVTLQLEGLRATFDSELPQGGQWLTAAGQGSATIDKLLFARAGAKGAAPTPAFTMTGMKIDSKVTKNGGLLDMVQTAAGRGTLGETPIESIKFELAIKHIDPEALLALQRLVPNDPQAEPAEPQQVADALQQALAKVMAAKPEYRTKVSVSFEGQTGEFGYGLALQDAPAGEAALPPQMPLQMQMLAAAQRIEGEAAVRVPKSWLPAIARGIDKPEITPQSIASMFNTFKAQGLLAEDRLAYSADLKYTGGKVLVNGKPFQPTPPRR